MKYLSRIAGTAVVLALAAPAAWAADPIKIGFAMAETGGLAVNGKAALVTMQMWADDVNAKGGLLGRPVQLIHYDDQSTPSTVPGIYTKLLDVDKVDLVVGPYATAQIAPALPVVMQHNMAFPALLGLAVNSEFHYDKYFAMIPSGPSPKTSFTAGFFNIAIAQNPPPKTIAIVAADIEFAHNAADGARETAKAKGLNIVYDKTYPGNIADCGPIVRAIQATNADIVLMASYPPDSACLLRAVKEIGYKPKLLGGAMVGLQATAIKQQLGPTLNGVITYDVWLPAQSMMFPGTAELLARYQAKAKDLGTDLLGYYMVPISYGYMQVVQQAVEGTKSLDQEKIAAFMRQNTFKTVYGDIKFGKDGEWAQSRMLTVQFQGVNGTDLDQFKDPKKTVILDPPAFKSGDAMLPFGG
jgi:branched-chain amino acid transport system substrate-binding protein